MLRIRKLSIGWSLIPAALLMVAGCSDPVREKRDIYIARVDHLRQLQESRMERIPSLPESARKELEELSETTAAARRRYFAAVESQNDEERKAATADEQAGNAAYDEALDRLLLEHLPESKGLFQEIAAQQALTDRAKQDYEAAKR